MGSRRIKWWLTGAGVVLGSIVVCAGIPLGVIYLLAQLQLDFLPSLAIGVAVWLAAMAAAGGLLRRLQALHVFYGPPPPPGLQPGSVLLEASLVIASVATMVGIVMAAVTGWYDGGGGLIPFPE